jgi:very-short-patch-repair endonuclease
VFRQKLKAETRKRLDGYRAIGLKNPTPAERDFRKLFITCFPGVQFEQQKIVQKGLLKGYLIDFYLPKLRLAIEVDGGYHQEVEQIIRDGQRTDYLISRGIKVIRLSNLLVQNKQAKCILILQRAIANRKLEIAQNRREAKTLESKKIEVTLCKPYTEKDYKRDQRPKNGTRNRQQPRKLTMKRN